MAKYKVVIEFDTDKDISFPADAALLMQLEVQLESLNDGTLEQELNGDKIQVSNSGSTIIKVSS